MELDFKLRYSSSERFCKDINGIIKDRFGTLRKIQNELETRQELATVLSNIVDNLHDKHLKLLATKGLCSCQSEEDASNFDKQLDPVEEQIKKSLNKLNALKSIKYAKVSTVLLAFLYFTIGDVTIHLSFSKNLLYFKFLQLIFSYGFRKFY